MRLSINLSMIEAKIKSFDFEEPSLICDSGPEEAYLFLKAVEEADQLTKILEIRNNSRKDHSLLHRAQSLLQRGMAGLELEFRMLLLQNWQPRVEEETSFRLVMSMEDSSFEEVEQGNRNCAVEIVPQEVSLFLKDIANLMYRSNYGHECFLAFVNARKNVLDKCLLSLGIEKLSIEDITKMSWKLLHSKINKWLRAIKPFVEVCLVSEKSLAGQIFGEIESVSSTCFIECSSASLHALINFSDALVTSFRQSEKLFSILDMYKAIADIIPQVATLYSDYGPWATRACKHALWGLGDCARMTFVELEDAVASYGYVNDAYDSVERLTKYVMNFLIILADLRETFDEVMIELRNESSSITVSSRISPQHELEVDEHEASYTTPTQRYLSSLVKKLEGNLNKKLKLYKDESLQHIFMMNNIQYMIQKVKGSNLQTILGDEWIKQHNGKVLYHAMRYLNVTWSSILAFLRDEGINNPATNIASRNIIKERLRCFYIAFEKVYRTQTRWTIPDEVLRDNLILWISSTVTHAYRPFQRHCYHMHEKHYKYSLEELEAFLFELFGGQKVLKQRHQMRNWWGQMMRNRWKFGGRIENGSGQQLVFTGGEITRLTTQSFVNWGTRVDNRLGLDRV